MDNTVFILVLIAAITHATWNGMVKKHSDKVIALSGVILGRLPLALTAIIILPLPSFESIPYLIISIIIHQAYQWYLLSAYELGDLTKVSNEAVSIVSSNKSYAVEGSISKFYYSHFVKTNSMEPSFSFFCSTI